MTTQDDNAVIDIVPGEKKGGDMHFSLINGKWRCAGYERRKAEDDTKRVKTKQEAKERL